MKPPKILNKMVDVVLNYRPESKQKPPRQRKISTKRLSRLGCAGRGQEKGPGVAPGVQKLKLA